MKAKTSPSLVKKYDINLGTYYFYKNCFIAEIREGTVIAADMLDELMPLIFKHYGNGQPFTYISNRVHSHSIIPTDYEKCPFTYLDNFKGYGVVTYNRASEMSIEVEKHFAKQPFHHFKSLEDALNWANIEPS